MLSFGQLAGGCYPTVGPRRLMAAGLAAVALLMLSLTATGLETSDWVIRVQMFAMGACMSFVFIPLQASAFARIPPADTGRASAIYNTQRQMASALGVAVFATILSARLPDIATASAPGFAEAQVNAFHAVFLAAANPRAVRLAYGPPHPRFRCRSHHEGARWRTCCRARLTSADHAGGQTPCSYSAL